METIRFLNFEKTVFEGYTLYICAREGIPVQLLRFISFRPPAIVKMWLPYLLAGEMHIVAMFVEPLRGPIGFERWICPQAAHLSEACHMRLSMSDPLRGSFFILRAFILVFLMREVRDAAKLRSFLPRETRHATSLLCSCDEKGRETW